MGAGVVGLITLAPAAAGADTPLQPVCGASVALTSNDTAASPATLSVPQYNGGDTLTGVTISIQPTETYAGEFLDPPSYQPFPGTATIDFVALHTVLEATAPGLSALTAVTPGVPANGSGPNSWTAGDPLPALPSGVAATEAASGAGVSTGSTTSPSWTALGYGFTTGSPAPATAQGTANFTTSATGTVPSTSFSSYAGAGNVSVSAADYSEDTVSSDSSGATGATVTTSLVACATYTVLGAVTPEVPSAIMLPAAMASIGLAGFFVVRRRRRQAAA
jgi:MYXO-CTERM domain-containing protein